MKFTYWHSFENRRIWLLLLLASWFGVVPSSTVEAQASVLVRTRVDETNLLIGDQFWLQLQISAPAGTEVAAILRDSVEANEQVEILEARDSFVTAREPELLIQQQFRLTTFDTGTVIVPPLQVVYQTTGGQLDTIASRPIELSVRGMPVEAESELQPIKPIIEEGFRWTDLWWLYLLLVLILVGIVLYSYFRNRAKRATPVPPPPPPAPHELALERLQALETKQLWQQGQLKAYHTELTHILREYLAGSFRIPALEYTTRQIDEAIARRHLLNKEQRRRLTDLLQVADLVKFAKAEPAAETHERALTDVRAFVLETRPATPTETES